VKLLFDENLSSNLTQLQVDLYPDSIHVRDVGIEVILRDRYDDVMAFELGQEGPFLVLK